MASRKGKAAKKPARKSAPKPSPPSRARKRSAPKPSPVALARAARERYFAEKARSDAAKRGAETKRLRAERPHKIYHKRRTPLHGRDREDLQVLRQMVKEKDETWTNFLALAKKLGRSPLEARNEWFSPKIRGKR